MPLHEHQGQENAAGRLTYCTFFVDEGNLEKTYPDTQGTLTPHMTAHTMRL